jgi:hypothetical protein
MPAVRVRRGQQLANPEGGVYEPGTEVELGDFEADQAIRMGVAIAAGEPEPEPEAVPEPEPFEPGDAVSGAVAESGVQVIEEAEPEPEAEVEAEEAGPVRPNTGDPKADWEDYVEALGGDPTDKTKAELQAEADRLEAG